MQKSPTNTKKFMPRYKIGLVLDDSLDRADGVQQYVKTLGGWLSSRSHEVHYLAGQSIASKNVHSLSKNVNVRFNGNRLSIPLPTKPDAINTLLIKEKFDVLHIQMPYSPFMAGKVVKHAPKTTAVVGTFHIMPCGNLQKHANKALGLVQKRQFKRFDAICSVSTAAQKFAKSHYSITSNVIPNMINLKNLQSHVANHPNRIIFLGRLVPRKGCMQLLKAVNNLPKSLTSGLEILIAGDGPERPKLEKFVKKHHLTNVVFLGFIAEQQKRDLLASAELAVFPASGGESFGIVLIESMAAGAGVVLGGDNAGYISVLAEVKDSLFDPGNIQEFSDKLQRYLIDKQLNIKIHADQQKLVRKYDVNLVGTQVLDMYKYAVLQRQQEMR